MDKQTIVGTKQSKALSWVLRHGAPSVGLKIDEEGFALLSDINKLSNKETQLKILSGMTLDDFTKLVNGDGKNRYFLTKITGKEAEALESYKIRANQGHSISVPKLELEELDTDTCPYVLHGTDNKSCKLIHEAGYLSCMSREYMHFSEEKEFKKLGRKNSPVIMKFDTQKALQNGIKFYRAKNNVILSKGKDGKLSVDYLVQ